MAYPFDPATVLIDFKDSGQALTIADAMSGICCMGSSGSGKTSAVAALIARAYLRAGFGGLILPAKPSDLELWLGWIRDAGRIRDLVRFDASGRERFNFLEHEASYGARGAGLTMNIVAHLIEIALSMSRRSSGGDDKFWIDALDLLLMAATDLIQCAGFEVSLRLMRQILNSAPQSPVEVNDPTWQQKSTCAGLLREAEKALAGADPELRADFEECRAYWTQEYPGLADRTRSIINLMFSSLARAFNTNPLRTLFSTTTTIRPEDTFAGRLIYIDMPTQEYRTAGELAGRVWRRSFQVAVMRRGAAPAGEFLRPTFLWADEAQQFLTGESDTLYQAVARSAGGCSVYLFQNRELLLSVLGSEAVVNSLLGNLNTKFFCQNSSPETNRWAAHLLGERFLRITSSTIGRHGHHELAAGNEPGHSATVSRSEERRFYVEPSRFTTLRRGGPDNDFRVDTVVYAGGKLFSGEAEEKVPYRLMTIRQR